MVNNNPSAQVYSSSTVMSYSNTGNGAPKVYQATTSTKTRKNTPKELVLWSRVSGGVYCITKSVRSVCGVSRGVCAEFVALFTALASLFEVVRRNYFITLRWRSFGGD